MIFHCLEYLVFLLAVLLFYWPLPRVWQNGLLVVASYVFYGWVHPWFLLPFLATTRILIAAVRAGMGREAAHEVIKENAVAVALAMREKGAEPDLLDRLAADRRLPLDRAALDAALADKQAFTGAAGSQVDAVAAAVDELVSRYPEAAKYTSGAIL